MTACSEDSLCGRVLARDMLKERVAKSCFWRHNYVIYLGLISC